MDKAIYVPIEDVSSTKSEGKTVVTIKPGASVYSRSGGGGFSRSGTISNGGVRDLINTQEAEQKRQAAEQIKKAAQQKLIEDMRKAGEKRAAAESVKRTQTALRSKQLTDSLRANEQIKQEAKKKSRGFSSREIRRKLKQLGTSSAEFRQASKAAREQFKQTGVSVTEQIRLEAEQKRKEVGGIDVGVVSRVVDTRDFKGSNFILSSKDKTFVPDMNLFISPSEPSGQATGQFRAPSVEEFKAIESARERGSFGGLVSGGVGLFDAGIKKIREFEPVKTARRKIKESGVEQTIISKSETILGAPIPEAERGITSPEGVRSLFGFGAEATLRGGEFLSEETIKRGLVTDPLLTGPSPISRKTAKELITDILTISAFAPLIATGTAQQTTQKVKVKTDKEKIKKLAKLREELRKASEKKVKEFVKKQSDLIKKNRNLSPAEKAERLKNLALTVAESRGLITFGEGGEVLRVIDIGKPSVAKITTTTPEIIIEVPRLAKIPKIPETTLGVSQLKLSQVGETKFLTGTGLFQDSLTKQKQATAQATIQLFGEPQLTKQATKQLTAQATKQLTKQAQATAQLLSFDTAQAQIQKPIQQTRQGFRQPIQRPQIQKPKPIPGLSSPQLQRVAQKILRKEPGYIAEIKERGKWKKVSKKPLRKKEAEKLAKFVTDETISASARVRQANKPAVMDLVRSFAINNKFRDFKIRNGKKIPQKNLWIEKRKFRLDRPLETRTLQEFKKSAKFKNAFKIPKLPSKKVSSRNMLKKNKASLTLKKKIQRRSNNIFFR